MVPRHTDISLAFDWLYYWRLLLSDFYSLLDYTVFFSLWMMSVVARVFGQVLLRYVVLVVWCADVVI